MRDEAAAEAGAALRGARMAPGPVPRSSPGCPQQWPQGWAREGTAPAPGLAGGYFAGVPTPRPRTSSVGSGAEVAPFLSGGLALARLTGTGSRTGRQPAISRGGAGGLGDHAAPGSCPGEGWPGPPKAHWRRGPTPAVPPSRPGRTSGRPNGASPAACPRGPPLLTLSPLALTCQTAIPLEPRFPGTGSGRSFGLSPARRCVFRRAGFTRARRGRGQQLGH